MLLDLPSFTLEAQRVMYFRESNFSIYYLKQNKTKQLLCEKPMDVVRKQLCCNLTPQVDYNEILLTSLVVKEQPPHDGSSAGDSPEQINQAFLDFSALRVG